MIWKPWCLNLHIFPLHCESFFPGGGAWCEAVVRFLPGALLSYGLREFALSSTLHGRKPVGLVSESRQHRGRRNIPNNHSGSSQLSKVLFMACSVCYLSGLVLRDQKSPCRWTRVKSRILAQCPASLQNSARILYVLDRKL